MPAGIRSGTRQLDDDLPSTERLRDWLAAMARESLDMELLPGICHLDVTINRLSRRLVRGREPPVCVDRRGA